MELIGFIMLTVGMAGMDTEGNMCYLAAAFVLVGLFLITRKERKRLWRNLKRTAERLRG